MIRKNAQIVVAMCFLTAASLAAPKKSVVDPGDKTRATSTMAVNLVPGSSESFTITANDDNDFAGDVMVTGMPSTVKVSPAKFTLAKDASQTVTLTAAASGLAVGNSIFLIQSSSKHSQKIVLNLGTQVQDFVLATPAAVSVAAGETTLVYVEFGAIGGYSGDVDVELTGLSQGVIAKKAGPGDVRVGARDHASTWFNLTGASTLQHRTVSFTITATSGKLKHSNSVVLTTAPSDKMSATVDVTKPGTPFPDHFIGFSMPSGTLEEFVGKGAVTAPGVVNLLSNLSAYVGAPNFRTMIPSGPTAAAGLAELHGMIQSLAVTVNGKKSSPQFFVTNPNEYTQPSELAHLVEGVVKAVGIENLLGVEMGNEPEGYIHKKWRPEGYNFASYLSEVAGYQTALATVLPAPKYITLATGNVWDPAAQAAITQFHGQLAAFTEHTYPVTACNGNVPKLEDTLRDKWSHAYYARYAGPVKTVAPVPVRVGEFNSVSCEGYAGVSNSFAASLWLVDMAFEAKSAGVTGFNFHNNGSPTKPKPYDMAWNNNGAISVFAPFYGMLFLARAIQNDAKPVPVAITEVSGNVKVWATVDAANTLRVVVLEKDMDGVKNAKTVTLKLGPYAKAGTLTTMTAPSVDASSGIAIAGQTFDGTTNGVLAGKANSASVIASGGVYTIMVPDGTAAMLTVPQ